MCKLTITTVAGFVCFVLAGSCGCAVSESQTTAILQINGPVVVVSQDDSPLQQLSAREIRRYVYLRTDRLIGVRHEMPSAGNCIVVAGKDSALLKQVADSETAHIISRLQPQQYLLKTIESGRRKILLVVGGDDIGVLYGAYRLAEHLGVRFYLHGDVVGDEKIPLSLPDVNETSKPLFALRGVNPWGSHPFGFDQWSSDDYKAVFTQLVRMRMNFLGIHCYPEGAPYAEPTVWVGTKGDFDEQGRVQFSYPANYYNTQWKGRWGPIRPKKTSSYSFGGSLLFAGDDWGPEVMGGYYPRPETLEACNEVFNRTGEQFRDAFSFARRLGIKTCVGTESPMRMPQAVRRRLESSGRNPDDPAVVRDVYEGIFRRIMAAHPLDYYWIWTPEYWTWRGNTPENTTAVYKDIELAAEALKNVGSPFRLATSGWVLGPKEDRAGFDRMLPEDVAMSAISRQIGKSPVDAAFAQVTGRDKWAIPWLEGDGDNGLAAVQLWVGRMRKDAADAHAYGCTGLMGLHWRTEILAPNASALAQAAWDQSGWNPDFGKPVRPALESQGPSGGKVTRFLAVDDFYADWAQVSFGRQAAADIARIFTRIDGKVPASVSGGCPSGSLRPDSTPWKQVAGRYTFVDELEQLRDKVKGAGNLDRYDYWLNTFRYHRSLHRIRCTLGRFNAAMKTVNAETNAAGKKKLAAELALPVWRQLLQCIGECYGYLLSTVNSNGALATVVNLENHAQFWPVIVDQPCRQLAEALGAPLPPEATPPRTYQGKPRLIVPTVRSLLAQAEPLKLTIILLDSQPAQKVAVYWRPLGRGPFRQKPAQHTARAIYRVQLPATGDDFEYYIQARTFDGNQVIWPAAAPAINQTVVIMP